MSKRAQIITIDFVGSVVIFMLALIGLIVMWNIADIQFSTNNEQEELISKAIKVTDLFVESQGIPTNWNETNVKVIGLVSSDRKVDSNKLTAFKNMTYGQQRDLLNIKSYEFYFKLIDINGGLITIDGRTMEIGNPIPNQERTITKIKNHL